ncbi:hypothetical protein DSCA_10490 [Desulfosarcina alkanivorans]|uniref:DUF5655 domain-containing protein n=1 Tax=Desulfosarcina alkanivorans TaxID=571177 RepID=A0A5K7YH14_9BACT|nr:hypothetical protein [Desulfosarcina alkanivorans]BBO67119.1 hypothetical protein DSCA_10490 [Desulfosarcina alkanivorans]
MEKEAAQAMKLFLDEWQDTAEKTKAVFSHLKAYLEKKEGTAFDFIPRPGVTYSLRAVHTNQRKKSLFVMVDVIEDAPRWLSVCFYGEMISDPEENGDFVPEGLLGEDAVCFDVDAWDDRLIAYVKARMDEAWQFARNG